jgi:predicted Zn-dependent peptidase
MPVTFHEHSAPSGLKIIAEVDPDAHSAAAGFFVRTGARDEAPPVMGVSHFLEHMMFKGTDRLSAEELNRRFDDLGARNNAYTTSEMTCFYAHLLPERLGEGLELLAQMMRPALRQDDFDREKLVILEEIAMYKDEPYWVLYERMMEEHYRRHPMGHRVLGTTDTITALQSGQMRDYFQSRYSADNTVVALAGRLDFPASVDRILALTESWRPTRVRRDAARPATGGGAFELTDGKITRAYLMGMSDAPDVADPRRYAAVLLAQILGASDNSRLHWALIETGMAEEAQAGYDPHDGVGDFYIFASGDPDRAEDIWATILKEIEGLIPSISEDDLVRLRNKVATSVTVGGERPSDRMQRIGRLWTYLGLHTPLEEELDRINRVSLDDLRALAEMWPILPSTVGRLMPAAAATPGTP